MSSQEAAAHSDREARHVPPSGHRLGLHTLAPVLVFAFGITVAFMSRSLGLGDLTTPGPGLWPFIASLVIVLSAAFLIARDAVADYEPWSVRSVRIAGVLGCLAAFIGLFQVIGLVLSGALLLAAWLKFFAGESWRTTLILAVALPIGLYLLFDAALGVPFPADVVGDNLVEAL